MGKDLTAEERFSRAGHIMKRIFEEFLGDASSAETKPFFDLLPWIGKKNLEQIEGYIGQFARSYLALAKLSVLVLFGPKVSVFAASGFISLSDRPGYRRTDLMDRVGIPYVMNDVILVAHVYPGKDKYAYQNPIRKRLFFIYQMEETITTPHHTPPASPQHTTPKRKQIIELTYTTPQSTSPSTPESSPWRGPQRSDLLSAYKMRPVFSIAKLERAVDANRHSQPPAVLGNLEVSEEQ